MTRLTLAVPTFNRIKWLELSLGAVLEQAAARPSGEIEVIVSDNCSTDGTAEYLRRMAARHSFLRINTNERNLGAEGNCWLIPQLASGEYLYMIGDDDVLEPGALTKIIDALAANPDYLVINCALYDNSLQKCVQPRFLPALHDIALTDQGDCLRNVHHLAMGFISAWVGKRDFFNSVPEVVYRQFSQWGMSIMLDRYVATSRLPRGKLIAEPLIRARRSDGENLLSQNFEYFEWFLRGGAEVLHYASVNADLSPAMVRSRKGWMLRHVAWRRILSERASGSFRRRQTFALLKEQFGELWQFWLLCMPTMTAPGLGILARAARRLARST